MFYLCICTYPAMAYPYYHGRHGKEVAIPGFKNAVLLSLAPSPFIINKQERQQLRQTYRRLWSPRNWYLYHSYSELHFNLLNSIVECCVTIIVSCASAFYLFWTHYVKTTHIVRRLGFGGSSTRRMRSFPTSKQGGTSSSGTAPVKVTTDLYIELDNAPNSKSPGYHASASGGMAGSNV